jgi:biotin-(acetyl-CoA carboxylase) ligase
MVGKDKICGILVEGTSKEKTPWAIVGIGLNVSMESAILRSIDRPATSMCHVLGCPVSLEQVTQRTCDTLCEVIAAACQNPVFCCEDYLESCSWMKGSDVVVQTATGSVEGTVAGFSPEGHLLLQLAEARIVSIVQGVIT